MAVTVNGTNNYLRHSKLFSNSRKCMAVLSLASSTYTEIDTTEISTLIFGHVRQSNFLELHRVTKFQREPSQWGIKCMGWDNFAHISLYLRNGKKS